MFSLGFPSPSMWSGTCLQLESQANHRAHFLCSLLSGVPVLCCQLSNICKQVMHIFLFSFLVVCSRRVSLCPVISSWPEADNGPFLFTVFSPRSIACLGPYLLSRQCSGLLGLCLSIFALMVNFISLSEVLLQSSLFCTFLLFPYCSPQRLELPKKQLSSKLLFILLLIGNLKLVMFFCFFIYNGVSDLYGFTQSSCYFFIVVFRIYIGKTQMAVIIMASWILW